MCDFEMKGICLRYKLRQFPRVNQVKKLWLKVDTKRILILYMSPNGGCSLFGRAPNHNLELGIL